MFHSLRFRLPALFLAGVVLAGIVSAAIAFRLLPELLGGQLAEGATPGGGRVDEPLRATGHQVERRGRHRAGVRRGRARAGHGRPIYYAGLPLFPGETTGLRRLPAGLIDARTIRAGESVTFEFTPPDEDRPYLAVGSPVVLEGTTFGTLVVAKPKTVLHDTWLTLMKFVGVSLLGGLSSRRLWAGGHRAASRDLCSLSRALRTASPEVNTTSPSPG